MHSHLRRSHLRWRPLRTAASLTAVALLWGPLACVSQSTYQALVDERDELARRRAALQEQRQAVESSSDELKTQLSEREGELSDLRGTYDALVADLKSELASGQVEIEQMRNGIRVNLSQEVLFPSGSAQLDGPGRAVLGKVAAQMASSPHRVEVEGHTDDVPIKGSLARHYPTNWELASARASQVVQLFQDQGIDGARLRAVSRSEFVPVASNDTPEGRERNRRIEIRLLPGEAQGDAVPAAPAG